MPPSVPLTSRTRAAKPILGVGAHRPTPGREPLQPACLCQAPESRAACQGLGWPPASGGRGSRLSCCGPAWAESEGRAWRGRCGEARPGCWLGHTPRRHSSGSLPALGHRFARAPEAGKGRCCHPADTSGSCTWATGASWHPAFVRQGRRRGWARRPSKQPDFRKPRATGPFPSHHSCREGKREKKKKACTSSAGKAARHPSRRQGCQSKQQEVKPQQSPRPSLTESTRAIHVGWDQRLGRPAPRPSPGV